MDALQAKSSKGESVSRSGSAGIVSESKRTSNRVIFYGIAR